MNKCKTYVGINVYTDAQAQIHKVFIATVFDNLFLK